MCEKSSSFAEEQNASLNRLINPLSGYRFHPRCPHAMHICREHFPERTDIGNGHWTNCFLYTQQAVNKETVTDTNEASKTVLFDLLTKPKNEKRATNFFL